MTFTGYVRDYAPGQATDTLYLEHYPGMCERELQAIAHTARERWRLAGTLIAHRVAPCRARARSSSWPPPAPIGAMLFAAASS